MVTDPDIVAGLSHDQAVWAPVGRAVAVVRAKSTDEVQTVVRACLEQAVPVVARGAGTGLSGLSGGANAVEGSVILALDGMDRVLEVDELEGLAVVQPGVVNDDLRAHVAALGLWYPPDPASSPWSTIGGNVATNAGGVCCVKYGVTLEITVRLRRLPPGRESRSAGSRRAGCAVRRPSRRRSIRPPKASDTARPASFMQSSRPHPASCMPTTGRREREEAMVRLRTARGLSRSF
ncbi:FAD-binding oxidoreductase [Streptomyces sp. STCH 565 A]|uniref:FAD-binding oxidoreductase n=1 Tax=Streptomyces sp. STCH 565 A TaxID=2950532 RepID=UPI0035B37E72